MYKTSYIKKRGSCNTEKLYLESVISFKPRRVSITCPKGLEHDFDVTSHDWTASSRPPCLLSFLKSFCILWVGSVSSCLSESTNSLQTACHLQQQGNQLAKGRQGNHDLIRQVTLWEKENYSFFYCEHTNLQNITQG